MDGSMIIYLHGFCSSPAAWKARLLAEEMARRGLSEQFACPQLPPVPDEAVAMVGELIAGAQGPVTLIGSSLGGHYANYLAEKHDLNAVLINPAAVGAMDLGIFVGNHVNFHTGAAFSFTEAHAEQLRAQVTLPTARRYWLLLESGDEMLDYRLALNFYDGCRQTVLEGGDHSFTRFPDFMPQIIEFAGL
jgi:uncharacterized protein